ncbi:MAG: PAS domain S-box protein [Candidatus Krumholzibacteriia bacterium]
MSTSRTEPQGLVLVGDDPLLADLVVGLGGLPRATALRVWAVIDLAAADAAALAREAGVPLVGTRLEDLAGSTPALALVASRDPDLTARVTALLPRDTVVLGHGQLPLLDGLGRLAAENRALRLDSHRLKETRLRLNQFVETAPMAIYIKDRDLRYRKMNAHALHVLALKEAAVLGRTDHAIYPGGSARWLQRVEQETLRTRQTLHASGVLPVQGQDMHVAVTLFPVVEDGRVEGLYGLVEDTTELYESEQKLHQVDEQLSETQTYLREVLENSRDMIFLTDPTGALLSFNSGAEQALGYSRDEVVGTPAHNLCASPGNFEKLFATALRDGHAVSYEAEFRSRERRPVICNISLTLIQGPDGKPLEMVCLCRDITTRVRLKNDLIRSERLAAVGQMASGVAHEINNPLAVIDTIGGLVEETLRDEGDRLDPETREILARAMDRLHAQVKRCTAITHSLLGFVRSAQHDGVAPLDLHALLDESLDVLVTEIRRAGVEVRRHYAPQLPPFRSDAVMLQQVFVNLVKNAVDAMEAVPDRPPVLDVTTAADAAQITVTVQDNGVGIPPEDRDRIFDLFHTTKPVGRGTGLGLSIVHDLLFRLGGSIRVASEPGRWSRFVVTLPLQPPETPRPDPLSISL